MLVLSTITDIQDQNIVNTCSQNLKSERCNVMVCAQSARWKRMGLAGSCVTAQLLYFNFNNMKFICILST